MDPAKIKLRQAEQAMIFLQRGIDGLKNPNQTPVSDPDYDLWSAHQCLQYIQDQETKLNNSGTDDETTSD